MKFRKQRLQTSSAQRLWYCAPRLGHFVHRCQPSTWPHLNKFAPWVAFHYVQCTLFANCQQQPAASFNQSVLRTSVYVYASDGSHIFLDSTFVQHNIPERICDCSQVKSRPKKRGADKVKAWLAGNDSQRLQNCPALGLRFWHTMSWWGWRHLRVWYNS